MIRSRIRRAARRGAMGLAGGLCLGIGIALLTVAGWIALASAAGHGIAALTFGLIYTGTGLILVALAGGRRDPDRDAEPAAPGPPPPPASPDLVQAFFRGLGAGAAARKGFDRGRGARR
ncbi:hypothetical protein GE300_05300 [Rhodobacteraceae bacterium 2CG4]|uniref:Uncharacterized protein n=1 Tax=Halovulum marinum TaxID=2662447 RepID=A0A6L5YYT9_9RHOB|nr:hypothetical protein [Halovulum marinum]MSU89042.1 hypothetical protein [Halovulum marinum]